MRRRARPLRSRLGPDFAKLWSASAISNAGDGITLAAGPLLVVSLTTDPLLVAGAAAAQQVPWLLFGLPAGAYVDRVDRRRLVVVVNVVRGIVIGALALTVALGLAHVAVIYAAFFLVGTCETLADNAYGTLMPAIVEKSQLPRANGRVVATFMVGNQFVGPPLGAALFPFSAALPFGVNAATFLGSAALIAALRYRQAPAANDGPSQTISQSVGDGVRWLWQHRMLRLIAATLAFMNLTYMVAFGVLVLYAREQLLLGAQGFGWLLTAHALGGMLGASLAGRLGDRFDLPTLLRVGLVGEALGLLALAFVRNAWVAGAVLAAAAVLSTIWGIAVMTFRQTAAPDWMLGRVTSVFMLFTFGASALGALLGGVIARIGGIAAPFWLAGFADLVLAIAVWHRFTPDAFAAAQDAGSGPPASS